MPDVEVMVLVRIRPKRGPSLWHVAECIAAVPTPHSVMEAARQALNLAVNKHEKRKKNL